MITLPPLPSTVSWSICLRDIDRDPVPVAHRADRVLRTASIGKVFLLIEIARRIEAGELDPDRRLTWRPEELVADSGLWYRLAQRELTVADLCLLIGAVSDNLATNVLVRELGVPAITAASRAVGCADSALLDRIRDERGPADPPTLSVGRADELSAVMALLHTGRHEQLTLEPSVAQRVRGWLSANTDLSMVAAAFGFDPLAHEQPDRGLLMINKTGTISTARADVGAVTGPTGSVAWAVLANWDTGTDPRDEVLSTMSGIGSAIRSAVTA